MITLIYLVPFVIGSWVLPEFTSCALSFWSYISRVGTIEIVFIFNLPTFVATKPI